MSCKRYDIDMGVAPREAVKLMYISKSRFGGDWRSTLHTHTCAELFYCVNGCGQFNIAGELYNVAQNDLIIINPMVEHTELSLNSNPLEYVVLGVEGIDFLFDQSNERFARINCTRRRDEILFLFQRLLNEVDEKGEGCETICQDLLEVLLIWLVRANSMTVRSSTARQGSKECAAVKRYMDEHYSEDLSLDLLAERCHMNKYYLSHSFSREYGTAPMNYLIGKRITESRSLLASTNYSVAEVSSILGFSSPSYFSQCFRRVCGASPSDYRRRANDVPAEESPLGSLASGG